MAYKAAVTEEELEQLLRPTLRLFFSVDVVGSTALKGDSFGSSKDTRAGTTRESWLEFFASFHTDLPERLKLVSAQLSNDHDVGQLPDFCLWKSLGDELVFYAELAHPRQAARCVLAFRNAMRWAFKRWSVKQPVLFKGTCWLAGFPVANAALPMTELHDDGVTQRCDFIGPQIDLGFRLKDRSSPRQCTMSVELAALIAKNAPNELRFFVEASTPLKGALKGRPYPWIWIDCFDQPDAHAGKLDIHDLEDRLLKREMVKPHDLEAFCLAYIKEVGRPLHVPFVYGQPQGLFKMPDQYESALREARDRLTRIFLSPPPMPDSNDGGTDPLGTLEQFTPPA